MTTQPEALRLADLIENGPRRSGDTAIAAELRRLHAINAELVATMKEVVRISDRQHDAWGAARVAIHKAEANQ